MRILINGISNSATGGLVILKLALNELGKHSTDKMGHNIKVILPSSFRHKNELHDNVTAIELPLCEYKIVQYITQIVFLPFISRRFDLILNLTDLPIITRTNQFYYADWPYLFEISTRLSLSKKIKLRCIRALFLFVDTVIFQKQKSSANFKIPTYSKYTYVMNISETYIRFIKEIYLKLPNETLSQSNDHSFMFYPAAPYGHKNFKLLYDALEHAENNKLEVKHKIYLTITKKEFLKSIKMNGLKTNTHVMRSFVFLGQLSHKTCLEYMRNSCALLFPSSKETLGLPLLEAIALKKPILVYDSDYARELVLDAYYFKSPSDLCELLTLLSSTLKLPKVCKEAGYVSWLKLIEHSGYKKN